MNDCLYLIGSPASGKTALFRELVAGLESISFPESKESPIPSHIVYPGAFVQLGAMREAFSGTDAMNKNCQPRVIEFLANYRYEGLPLIAEGYRLANSKFFESVRALDDWNLSVVCLDCPEAVAVERRKARGSNQDPVWLKGCVSKVRTLSERWVLPRWHLDGCLPTAELVQQLRGHPFLRKKVLLR